MDMLSSEHSMDYGPEYESDGNSSDYEQPMYSVDMLHDIYRVCQRSTGSERAAILDACDRYNAIFNTLFNNNTTETESDDTTFEEVSQSFGGRFIPYTVISCLAVIFNIISVAAMIKIRAHWACHHVLLLNLAVCDIVGAVLLWMYHNSPALFPHFSITTLSHCLFISVVLVAPFILTLCNSSCNLLLLALNLYLAICHPLFSATKLTKSITRLLILLTWLCSVLFSCVPLMVMLYKNQSESCHSFVVDMAETALEICAYVLVTLIIVAISLYARIYHVILKYRKTARGLHRNHQQTGSRDRNYKAFLTTLVLAGALVVFWLPYMIFSFITAYLNIDDIPDIVLEVKFYFIDFLPVLHFLTDPAIYGLRIMEIRRGYKKLFCRHKPQQRQHHSSMETRTTLIRSSVISVDTTCV